jgi:predicted lysophospholipase L1 biosynthesis ABC-type transport system permease subunit
VHFAFDHLRAVARQEWPLALLALIGVAPGVATLLTWLNLALALRERPQTLLLGWLLPTALLERLGAEGVLVGAGMVTLLIGCLGLTNAYLASLERRTPTLVLLRRLGVRRHELHWLLTLEAIVIGLLGGSGGLLLGLLLSRVTWPAAALYLALPAAYLLQPMAALLAFAIGCLAVLLFLYTAARLTRIDPTTPAPGHQAAAVGSTAIGITTVARNSWYGTLYGALLTLGAGLLILPAEAALLLALVAALAGTTLNSGGWLLTRLYGRLPLVAHRPLWTLAVQGLARHPNHTAGMTLAMTAGAYAVGMAALSWLASAGFARFPFWVAGLILMAGATLVFTVAALAVWERRTELAMVRALGARRNRLWQLVLLEYGIVALGGGSVGALLALVSWVASGQHDQWFMALAIVLADLVGALLSSWIGAAPVLWHLARQQRRHDLHHIG